MRSEVEEEGDEAGDRHGRRVGVASLTLCGSAVSGRHPAIRSQCDTAFFHHLLSLQLDLSTR